MGEGRFQRTGEKGKWGIATEQDRVERAEILKRSKEQEDGNKIINVHVSTYM